MTAVFIFKLNAAITFERTIPPHQLKLALCIFKGDVLDSSCTCVAGKAGFCNHISALMFKICKYSLFEVKTTKDLGQEKDKNPELACTSQQFKRKFKRNFAVKQIIQAPQVKSYIYFLDDYKRQRNKVMSLKRNALKTFCCDPSLSAKHPGEFWRKMKPLLPTSSSKNIQGVTLIEGSSIVSNPGCVAKVFSDYFANTIQLEHRSDTGHPSIIGII